MAKRKREASAPSTSLGKANSQVAATASDDKAPKVAKTNGHVDVKTTDPVIQIITGSYERVLHGITASITGLSSSKTSHSVHFADSFLFNAHASAVRCLALSPLPDSDSADSQGVYLATGGSDEKINVYSLSATPAAENDQIPLMPSLGHNSISENPRNRELGTLLQHSSNITALHFPTRSKLLSGSEDNTIAVTRLKDLTVVSTVKAPRPKVQGQPSGDTAPPGATPAGINDFAVHPSLKLMVTVGRGEKCMRLWNLVTGKKAGVLNFSRDILQSVREGKYSSGEGRRIRWCADGSEFAVAFERGAVIFGEDSRPKCKALPQPLTKVHQLCYVPISSSPGLKREAGLLAVSTEDGRILFYNTDPAAPPSPIADPKDESSAIPDATLIAQIGGKSAGFTNRIKDFEVLSLFKDGSQTDMAVVTASSDGTIRVIHFLLADLEKASETGKVLSPLGSVIAEYETGNRITCLKAFVMLSSRGTEDQDELDEDDEGSADETEDSESESGDE